MSNQIERGKQIRAFILKNISGHPSEITSMTGEKFNISRQAVNKHLQRLIKEKKLKSSGSTRKKTYHINNVIIHSFVMPLANGDENKVWVEEIEPKLKNLPDNVKYIWNYGFTEMLNNAIDHSNGKTVTIVMYENAIGYNILIHDNGEGIFKKIKRILKLDDERHAVLELAKGKLTTDPDNHSGEGIFFSSRMFDSFTISSGDVYFTHNHYAPEDWIMENDSNLTGTFVDMEIANDSSRDAEEVFDDFTSDDEDYGFNQTVVPVRLAQYGNEKLISRSQAKRLIARFEKFKTVLLDFSDIGSIGQAFADQVFRVFNNQHPKTKIIALNMNKSVEKMINRALTHDENA